MLNSCAYIICKVIDYGNLGVCVYGYDVRIHTIDRFVNHEIAKLRDLIQYFGIQVESKLTFTQ